MGDYGVRPNRAAKRMVIRLAILLAVLAAAGVAFLLWSNKDSRDRAITNSTASMGGPPAAGGTPCDPGTPEGKLGRGDVWKSSDFNGVEFGRRVGNIDCGVVKDKSKSGFAAVCQFTAPAELRVTTKDGPHYFDVGLGHPATVTVSDSGIVCTKG